MVETRQGREYNQQQHGQCQRSPDILTPPGHRHYRRCIRLSGSFTMYTPMKRVEMSLCWIASVVSYLPTHVVPEHASGRRCGLPISDLSHRLEQPAMTSICKPQAFFKHLARFFDGHRCLLGLLSEIWRLGDLRKEERGQCQLSTRDRDNHPTSSHYPRRRTHRHTSPLYGPSLDPLSRGRRRNRKRFAFKPLSRSNNLSRKSSLPVGLFPDPSRPCGS